MQKYPQVILKPGKEKILKQKSMWIFSGAIAQMPELKPGEIAAVVSSAGQHLGYAYFNPGHSLCGRVLSFSEQEPLAALTEKLEQAWQRRQLWLRPDSNAFRLINGENDGIPGLIVDWYAGYLVFQIQTMGMELLRQNLVEIFEAKLKPVAIYEKSHGQHRQQENLGRFEALHRGQMPALIQIKESGLSFELDLLKSQKTGFFLDQAEMRRLLREIAAGKKVLNTFCYTGAFSVNAAAGGAQAVVSVDISQPSLDLAQKNMAANGFAQLVQEYHCQDVYKFIQAQNNFDYDLVVLDPPAFAKKKQDLPQALNAYRELNSLTLKKMPSRSYLMSFSCSYHMSAELFQTMIFQASLEAKRQVYILGRHRLSWDHSLNIFHPEGDYLKGFLLWVE